MTNHNQSVNSFYLNIHFFAFQQISLSDTKISQVPAYVGPPKDPLLKVLINIFF